MYIVKASLLKPAGVVGRPRCVPRPAFMFCGKTLAISKSSSSSSSAPIATQSSLLPSAVLPVTPVLKPLGLPPSPELGLLSLLFVLSTAIGAIFSLAIISIPTVNVNDSPFGLRFE
ncbi:uncharacterized protein LOC110643658 [Hevea brasiliensis]|uniref:uncharacterized protein LOC110643658 n=1 Tax=Hevea brasiliensis TaxID=3981 RepID=UPI000B7842E7|nr:uncharacterized protein LOC110643658 [Hevea brasiliensis]